jgi:uncharacterized protein (DUF302 family)
MELTIVRSPNSVGETIDRLTGALRERDIRVVARIDHAGAARDVGLDLPAEEVLIFGDPRAGTPLMQADPRVGLELPLRIVVWSQNGATHVGYRSPELLAAEYEVGVHADVLSGMANLFGDLIAEATG